MSRHSGQLNCKHNRIMFELPRLRLIYHLYVIVGTCSSLIVTLGIAGNGSNAVFFQKKLKLDRMPHKSCLQQNEKNVLSSWSVSSVCLCCSGFPRSPLWLKTLDSDIYEEDSSKSPLSPPTLRSSMPFIPLLSDILAQNDREDGWPFTSRSSWGIQLSSCSVR